MGRKKEACADCLQRCLQFHGKNKHSSTSLSFFKVMIGDQFTKVLYLPPMFAAKMSKSIIDQTTFLEDSQGRKWIVTMRSVNGTLAFEKGWSAFSSDYDLQVGNFIVFDFIGGSHFFVRIYDKSACEKEFSPKNIGSKKRIRSSRFDVIEVESCNDHDNDSLNGPSSSPATLSGSNIEKSPWFEKNEHHMNISAKNKGPKPVCTNGPEEELWFMINRGVEYEREVGISPTTNLFDLEMVKDSSRTNGFVGAVLNESLDYYLDAPLRMGNGSQSIDENGSKTGLIENDLASEDVDIKVSIRDKDFSIPLAIESKGRARECDVVGEVMKFQIDEVKGNLVSTPSRNNPLEVPCKERSLFINSCQTVENNIIPEFNLFNSPNPFQAHNCQHGELGKIIKKERFEMTLAPLRNNPLEVHRKEHSSFITSCQTIKNNIIPEFNLFNSPNPIQAHNLQHGELGKIIKKERVEMTLDWTGEMTKVIKKERVEAAPVEPWKPVKEEPDEMTPGLFEDEENLNILLNYQNPFTIEKDDNEGDKEIGLEVRNSIPSDGTISCTVAENRSFLKLPSSLSRWGIKWERRVVYLLDSMERIWPVLYLETTDFNVLTSGWEAFCRANDIQAGQECVFKAVNEIEGRYQVSIRRNS